MYAAGGLGRKQRNDGDNYLSACRNYNGYRKESAYFLERLSCGSRRNNGQRNVTKLKG